MDEQRFEVRIGMTRARLSKKETGLNPPLPLSNANVASAGPMPALNAFLPTDGMMRRRKLAQEAATMIARSTFQLAAASLVGAAILLTAGIAAAAEPLPEPSD